MDDIVLSPGNMLTGVREGAEPKTNAIYRGTRDRCSR